MRRLFLYLCAVWSISSVLAQQQATVKEIVQTMKTYPFSDPDPVANPSRPYYPYFRFDGFAATATKKAWKIVELENEYIKLSLYPEVGGKIWGAVDKTSDKEFVYNNHVVKFRDIAMRGPWISGGIEFNFGIIGHAPTSSTPVDYMTREKEDGSVSCYISSYEWVTRTVWTVEVNLPKDRAYFTTTTTWFNQSDVDQPYYQWMNAAYKAAGNPQFCYPGNHYIGHNGDVFPFPKDEEGRDLSWYRENNFGGSKSEHVLGFYNDYYGIYWHDDDFGTVHHADYDEKLGMKIFLWSQARDGGIWEELLTDTDGQYVELQSGRMYNQPTSGSSMTPYKHFAFAPQMTDQWTEYWFPVKGIQSISKASRIGALHVKRIDGNLQLAFSPLQPLSTTLKIYNNEQEVKSIPLQTKTLEPWSMLVSLVEKIPEEALRIVIGHDDLVYSEKKEDYELTRPMELPVDFDWNSVYGLYTQGEQWMNQKINDKAEQFFQSSLSKDANFAPALVRLASLYFRQGRIDEALPLLNRALSLNTYDAEANYLYGLCHQRKGRVADAKAGFSIAAYSSAFRSAAYAKLGEMSLKEENWKKAEHYGLKSLDYNRLNLDARQVLMVAYRKSGQHDKAMAEANEVLKDLPLYHFARYEKYKLAAVSQVNREFTALVRNELPNETYMELAGWYELTGCIDEAMDLLSLASGNPIAEYRLAYLFHLKGMESEASGLVQKANATSPDFVFPFRPEAMKALEWAAGVSPDWKIRYYQGLIYWANQNSAKALQLFNTCGIPAYAPFYLTRSLLKKGDERLADLLTAQDIELSWRTGFALLNHYSTNNQWQMVIETGKKYMKKYPDNYYIGLKYAKGLCETGQYAACISLLRKLLVLPNEGSYAGRDVFRSANLYQAMDFLKHGNISKALVAVAASKEWPENLGVGKPYDDMIDNRLEDYIEACIYKKTDQKKAAVCYKRVTDYTVSATRFESGNLLTAIALRELGEKELADRMVISWSQSFQDNKVAQWCIAVYNNDTEKASSLLGSVTDSSDSTPWEASFRDANFNLIVRLLTQ